MALGEKLGKLSIAILENFVEDKLGKKFVDELRAPTDKTLVVAAALENTEARFQSESSDQEVCHLLFVELKPNAKSLGDSVGKFYDHPTSPGFYETLNKLFFGKTPNISKERGKEATDLYVKILTEELALADETFRENVRGLADLHGEASQREMVEILKRVETLLSQQKGRGQENGLRSLHQLPPAPSDYTGREEQLTQILDALAKHKGAAITGLTGMGGVGKTALGLVAAHKTEDQFPDAQLFLDLKGVTNPLLASDALRHIILSFAPTADLRESNEEGLAALYQSLLADKKVLVFMDNARDAAQVRALIPASNSCALIVTSRTGFALPNMTPLKLDVLPKEKAIELLLEICERIGETAKEISFLCGYLPLTLRIAATFLVEHKDFAPQEYIERLKVKRLKTLHGEDNDPKFDLEIIIGESYEQLTKDEQKYWRALSVFPASFKREAAAAVWQVEEDAARDLLSKFQRWNLSRSKNVLNGRYHKKTETPWRYWLQSRATGSSIFFVNGANG